MLVIAEDPLARTGLASLLSAANGMAVVGQVSPHAEILNDLGLYQPEVVLWNLGWGTGPMVERLVDLQETPYPVLALVTDGAQASEAWAAGVKGALPRDSNGPSLVAALQAVWQGLSVLAAEFCDAVMLPRLTPATPLAGPLTVRENEVLSLLADGLANKSIGQRLSISEHTVKFHVNAVMGKLGAQSRTEAVTLAVRRGLVHLQAATVHLWAAMWSGE